MHPTELAIREGRLNGYKIWYQKLDDDQNRALWEPARGLFEVIAAFRNHHPDCTIVRIVNIMTEQVEFGDPLPPDDPRIKCMGWTIPEDDFDAKKHIDGILRQYGIDPDA